MSILKMLITINDKLHPIAIYFYSQALLKRGWIEVAVGRSGSHRVHSSLSHAAAIRHAKDHHGGERHKALGYSSSHDNSVHGNSTSGSVLGGRSSSKFK